MIINFIRGIYIYIYIYIIYIHMVTLMKTNINNLSIARSINEKVVRPIIMY